MSTFVVPPLDEEPWPTLGPQVCEFIEDNLVFGPGDLRGEPAIVDPETRGLIYRMYEVYPQGHPQAGRRRFKRVAISLRKGTAKALALDTPLPTPSGWTTMGDISAGDQVLGSDGKPYRVTDVSPVLLGQRCFEVRFNDGSRIIADAGHRWATKTRRHPRQGSGVFTTEQIRDTLHWHPSKSYANHRVAVVEPLSLPNRDLPVDPYVLGIWLGDGTARRAEVTSADAEVFAAIEAAGYPLTYDYPAGGEIARTRGIGNGFYTALRKLDLLGNKHVPAAYLRASRSQRLALLQGLMDSDGTADKRGRCEFRVTSEPLARGTFELACTLGLRPTWGTTTPRYQGRDQALCYRVGFTPRDDVPPFQLERKAKNATKQSQALARTICAVDPAHSVPVRCIAVDSPDHLYLAGEAMVPTHNTEKSAWITAVELHPEGPVRCDGFDANGHPVGVAVRDPYIPLVAVTEEQTEELAYAALMAILEEGPLVDDFDIGLERITRIDGTGRAVALASAPNARDGARTTFEPFDETHRWILPRLVSAHSTMLGNIPKRKLADAWSLETTTAFVPGEGSVAEGTWEYAELVGKGELDDPRLFFFHRQASDDHDLSTDEGVRAAVVEASGPAAEWSDVDSIIAGLQDPKVDRAYWERVWLNRPTQDARQAFSATRWSELEDLEHEVPARAAVVIGVDGARFRDGIGIVATEVSTGYQWSVGIWDRPALAGEDYEHPLDEIDAAMIDVFERFNVQRVYIDPQWIDHLVTRWTERWGERIFHWETHRNRPMARAVANFASALKAGDQSHDGDEDFAQHIANARRRNLKILGDADGKPLWVIEKERSDSPKTMDGAMAAILSWQARGDVLQAGGATDSDPLVIWV